MKTFLFFLCDLSSIYTQSDAFWKWWKINGFSRLFSVGSALQSMQNVHELYICAGREEDNRRKKKREIQYLLEMPKNLQQLRERLRTSRYHSPSNHLNLDWYFKYARLSFILQHSSYILKWNLDETWRKIRIQIACTYVLCYSDMRSRRQFQINCCIVVASVVLSTTLFNVSRI